MTSDLNEAVEKALLTAKTDTHPLYAVAPMRAVLIEELARLGYQIHRTDPAKGGRARAEVLAAKRRTEIASNAAKARWARVDRANGAR